MLMFNESDDYGHYITVRINMLIVHGTSGTLEVCHGRLHCRISCGWWYSIFMRPLSYWQELLGSQEHDDLDMGGRIGNIRNGRHAW